MALKRVRATVLPHSRFMDNASREFQSIARLNRGSLGLSIAIEDRDELIAAAPDVYYVTEHYVGYPCVLVRMSRINEDVLRDLLGMAYKFATRKKRRK